jgi:FKBP-type peptidyl-prolyl cis-trans isomerase SlyD
LQDWSDSWSPVACNHPLAGIALRLRLRIEGVREATEEEIGRGSAGTGFFRIQPMVPGNDTLH